MSDYKGNENHSHLQILCFLFLTTVCLCREIINLHFSLPTIMKKAVERGGMIHFC